MKAAPAASVAQRSVILGTAGHIDHGKTALVRALTGTDTDRLPEEKRRGITIDLGFAAMSIPAAGGAVVRVSLIDVPGHHAFIRNMLAGAGGIDAVLLVIAADEGVMAQTREHLDICSLLGIERGIVVLSKADIGSAEALDSTRRSVASWLASTFLRDAPILAVSARTGAGLPELRSAMAQLVARLPERRRDHIPRLPPDRAFAMRGFGTVVTGTLQSGAMASGSTLELLPGGARVRVRGVQVHGQAVESVAAPSRVALNLSGLEHREIHRGQMLVPLDTLPAVFVVDAEIALLPHAPPLRHRARVRLHAFTGDIAATVLLYQSESTPSGGSALVRLQLESPQVLVPGDRFVLRQPSPAVTLGGGLILDTSGRRRQRKADTLRWLLQLRDASREEQIRLRIQRHEAAGVHTSGLVRETGLTAAALTAILQRLAVAGEIVAGPGGDDFWIGAAALAKSEAALLRAVSEAKGSSMPRAELRSRSGLSDAVFSLALGRLLLANKLAGSEMLSLPGAAPEAEEQQRLGAVEREYRNAGLAPPLLREAAASLRLTEPQMRAAVTLLLRRRRLLRLGSDDLFIHCDAVAQLADQLRRHRGDTFDVARFKSLTGLTRKHAIPLLELLDRSFITRSQPGTAGTRIVL